MRFAICNELFEGWAFDRVCRYVKSVGYDGLEVAPFTLAPRITDVDAARRSELRRQAEDAGVRIIGLHWLLARTEGLYLTSPDAAVRQHTSDYLVALAEATRDFGKRLAEREIRMVKLRQKVSGCLRTLTGAKQFCAIRSYLSTAAKHGRTVFDTLVMLAEGHPWLPTYQ